MPSLMPAPVHDGAALCNGIAIQVVGLRLRHAGREEEDARMNEGRSRGATPLLVIFGAGASFDSIRALARTAGFSDRPPLAQELFGDR
jgi:hypothetical protein